MLKKVNAEKTARRFFSQKITIVCIVCLIVANTLAYSFFPLTKSGYPLLSFMTTRGRFDDFYNSTYLEFGSFINTKGNLTLHPLSVLIGNLFSVLTPDVSAIIFFVLFSGLLFYAIGKLSNSILIPIMVFVSYPYQFTIARGNNEIILVAIAAFMYLLVTQKRFKQSFKTLIILNLVEPYPLYFLQYISFKSQIINQAKKYIKYASILIVGALLTKNGRTYILELISEGRGNVNVVSAGTTLHSSSYGGTMEFIWSIVSDLSIFEFNYLSTLLLAVQFIAFSLLFLFLLRKKDDLDLVTSSILIISFWTLFNNPSFDYRLLHFFIPISLMFKENINRKDLPIIIIMILIFIPKPYILFIHPSNLLGVTLGSIMNPILIFSLIFFTLRRLSNNSVLLN